MHQRLLAGIGAVAIHAPLPTVQQLRQRVLVVDIGRRHHGAVRPAALAVHANVQLHAKGNAEQVNEEGYSSVTGVIDNGQGVR
jgi:hypothetical protein